MTPKQLLYSFQTYISQFRQILVLGLFLLFITPIAAQDFVEIKELALHGNKWTRDYIIEKELDIAIGDSIDLKELTTRLEDNRNRLLNTGLFNQVEINLSNWDLNNQTARVEINLVENWFWYPVPVLELADRSINEWFYQHKASLKRMNLGIRFMHINLSGNRDRLKFTYHTGFTQKYEVDYTFPYINRDKTLGAYINVLYATNKEIAFETWQNQLHFSRLEDQPLLTRFRTSLGMKYRKNKSYYHAFFLEYHRKTIADTISQVLNPNYFNPFESEVEHLSLHYRFVFTNVDKKIYPSSGYRVLFDARKDGFGVFQDLNHLYLAAGLEQHFKLSDSFSTGYKLKGRKGFGLNKNVPYAYLPGLGYYDDVLSGYQLYVIDGLDFIYLKTYQKIQLAELEYDLNPFMPLNAFKIMPLKIYLGIHGDLGYVHESTFAGFNPFNNRLLLGAALSLDLIIYENYFFSCEFTVNHTGEVGIFLQGINTFE